MVMKPRDAAVQMLSGNWDLVRHEMGKPRQAAVDSRQIANIWQLKRMNDGYQIARGWHQHMQRTQRILRKGK